LIIQIKSGANNYRIIFYRFLFFIFSYGHRCSRRQCLTISNMLLSPYSIWGMDDSHIYRGSVGSRCFQKYTDQYIWCSDWNFVPRSVPSYLLRHCKHQLHLLIDYYTRGNTCVGAKIHWFGVITNTNNNQQQQQLLIYARA